MYNIIKNYLRRTNMNHDIKILDERYKSTADNGLRETAVSLVEAFDPDLKKPVYGVLIKRTFNDGVEVHRDPPAGEIFQTLEAAQEYFTKNTAGMYRSPEEEFLAALNCLKPKQPELPKTNYVDLFKDED